LRAAYALDRFERTELERDARAKLGEGDPLRTRAPLASVVCSPEVAAELRRVFKKVVELSRHLNDALPVGREKRHVTHRSDVADARLAGRMVVEVNALPCPRTAKQVAQVIFDELERGERPQTLSVVTKAVELHFTKSELEITKRLAKGKILDVLGSALRSRVERVERVAKRSSGKKGFGPRNVAEFELESTGHPVPVTELLVFCDIVLRNTRRPDGNERMLFEMRRRRYKVDNESETPVSPTGTRVHRRR